MLGLAGLAELTRVQSVLLIAFLIFSLAFIPVSVHKTAAEIGLFHSLQIPIIALALLLAGLITRRRRMTWGKTILILVATHVISTTVTNVLAVTLHICTS